MDSNTNGSFHGINLFIAAREGCLQRDKWSYSKEKVLARARSKSLFQSQLGTFGGKNGRHNED